MSKTDVASFTEEVIFGVLSEGYGNVRKLGFAGGWGLILIKVSMSVCFLQQFWIVSPIFVNVS